MAPSGSKRQNAMLERSYKKATSVRDERKGAYVNPTRVIEAAFLFFALKALNNHCESTHGISPWREAKKTVGDAVRRTRRWLSRLISPHGDGGGHGGGSKGGTGKKRFAGKGKRLGKK